MRSGTHSTKTRGEVQGSTRKIRRQKYTGAARAGSARAPTRVHGGIVFGPKPRDYSKSLNKKMKRLAIRSALSGKVADGQLVVIDQLAMEAPKTKEMIRLLATIGFERSALVVTGNPDRTVLASVRNLEKTKMIPAAYLNVVDMMNHAGLLMTEDAVRVAEKLWGKKEKDGGVTLAPRKKMPIEEEKPKQPSRRSRARLDDEEDAPAAKAEAKTEEPPTGRKTKFVPKGEAEAEAEAPAAEAVTEAPAAEAEEGDKPKRAPRAAKVDAGAEATTEAAEKPARAPRKKAEPAAEGEAPGAEAKPKRARAPKAEKPATEGGEEKPKRAPKKKTEEGE
jgi:large subunit ribosomal protein L4